MKQKKREEINKTILSQKNIFFLFLKIKFHAVVRTDFN